MGIVEWLIRPDAAGWLVLERIGTLLQYVTVISIAYATWEFARFLRRFRARRQLLHRLASGETARPQALAVSFGGSIRPAVEAFLATAYPGRWISVREYRSDEEVTRHTVHRHEEALRKIKEEFQAQGVTELHLFVKGPVVVGAILGALLDNWVAVKLYHNNRQGQYEEWTMLHFAKELSLRQTLEDAAAVAITEHRDRSAGRAAPLPAGKGGGDATQ